MDKQTVDAINQDLLSLTIEEQLRTLAVRFEGKIAFSTSFGQEDQLITHFIFSNNLPIRVFTLDTGRVFQETYKTWNKTLAKYQKTIEVYFPETSKTEKLLNEKGPFSFYESIENRKECCQIRKVEPLKRALLGVECWITGLRAEQSEARKDLGLVQWDDAFQLMKFNPLLNWKLDQMLSAIDENNVPYNALHDRGFISIGCEPCTRAIAKGEDIRAGRWWWEDQSKKECGLHAK